MMPVSRLLLLGAILLLSITLHGQREKPIWYGLAYSYPIQSETLPENVRYESHLITGYASIYPFYHNFWRRVAFYAEPQLALVSLSPVDDDAQMGSEIDAGLNLGVRFDWLTLDYLTGYLFIGAGPHYFPTETALQSRGFLFSDNFGAGFYVPLPESKIDLGVQFRYRHMSNAGIEHPNGGIDNFFLGLGLYYKPNWDSGCHCPKW